MGEPSDSDRRHGLATLDLCEAAPDSVWLPDLERITATLRDDRTDLAHSFCSHFSPLPFVLALLGTWGKEEVGVVAATQSNRLPGTIL